MKRESQTPLSTLLTPEELKNADRLKDIASSLGVGPNDLTPQRWSSRIASMLYDLRKRGGLTQGELASESGLTQAYLSRLENGLLPRGPTLDVLGRYVMAAGYDIELVARSKSTGEYVASVSSSKLLGTSQDVSVTSPGQLPLLTSELQRLVHRFDALPVNADEIDVRFRGDIYHAHSRLQAATTPAEPNDRESLREILKHLRQAQQEVSDLLEAPAPAAVHVTVRGDSRQGYYYAWLDPASEFTDAQSGTTHREQTLSIGKRIMESLKALWPLYKRVSKEESSINRARLGKQKIEVALHDLVVIGRDHEMHFSSDSSSSEPHKLDVEGFVHFGEHKN